MKVSTPSAALPALLQPVALSERISSIDCIRGFAVLGILAANITLWSLPPQPPTMLGSATELNVGIWAFVAVSVWGAMRGIFSMLFGAGMVLLTSRGEARGSAAVADIYFRRLLWLMLFGLIHDLVLLSGQDILFHYGLVGLFLYPFRKLRARTLLLAGSIVLVFFCIPDRSAMYLALLSQRDAAAKAEAARSEGRKLTQDEERAIKRWNRRLEGGPGDSEAAKKAINRHREGYWSHVRSMASDRLFPIYKTGMGVWDHLGAMLFGMGIFKLGIFNGKRSLHFYLAMAVLCYAVALLFRGTYAFRLLQNGFSEARLTDYWYLNGYFSMSFWQVARMFMAMGHVGMIIVIIELGILRRLMSAMADTGRMALTNYLAQTVICTFIFYGFGLGLYAKLELHQVYLVCICIWLLQLLSSSLWLRFFRFGPCEWLWRSLTYWNWQPMLASSR